MPAPSENNNHQALRDEQRSLKIAIFVTAGIMAVEIFGGIVSNSLALFSDAWHMFTDTSALALCFIAGNLSLKPPTSDKTFGFHRVEILSALVNGVTLMAVALLIFYQAIERILVPAEVGGFEMLIIALIGLVANLFSMTILSRSMLSLSAKSAFLHVTGDAASSVGVVATGIIIFFTKWYLIDPLMSIAVGSIIMYSTGKILREVLHILLEGVPSGIRVNEVVGTIREVCGVKDVHDIHIWSVTSYMHYLSAHIVVAREDLGNINRILNEVKGKIDKEYDIRHTTLQVEAEGYEEIGEVHT